MVQWDGIGGLSHGSFFLASDSVDKSKAPGKTEVVPESLGQTFRKILIGEAFCYSPNLTWFLMAACSWCIFPYNLESPALSSTSRTHVELINALFERVYINYGLAMTYICFWHWVLYIRGICERPFVPNRVYNVTKVLHNVFYTMMGLLHWTIVEGAFIYLYRTGKLPYSDASISRTNLLTTLLLSIALPPFRDVHFYLAHRFIHIRCLYKYIHSLHHRNTDIEPFSGIAMHPIEHMYYFTCYGPLLLLPLVFPNAMKLSPFLVFWMGFHLVVTPAASHSGYEDHFSSDVAHYLHHRYCECNYSGGINFDAYFGTYRGTIKESFDTNDKNETKTENNPPAAPIDPKASLGFPPEHPEYELGIYTLILGSLLAYEKRILKQPWVVGIAVSFGPTIWAFLLSVRAAPKSMSWRKICLAPFDKDSSGSLIFHFGLGTLLAVFPATYLVKLVLEE